jgi:hypothetical protein
MSAYGIGQGLDRGVRMAADFIMKGLEMKQKDTHFQQAMDYDRALDTQAMDYNREWQRGIDGLPPSDHDEEQAAEAAATRPAIPSSTPITKPGPMGFPMSRFDTGRPIQPVPAAPVKAPGGALGLLLRRPSNMGMMSRRRRGY